MKDDAFAIRILLVDSNRQGLTARRLILKDHGYSVDTATGGEEAWELFQKNHFDVVVTDLKLSGVDGLELIRRIHAAETPAGTILLSGFVNCLGLTPQTTGADELINKSNKEVPELLRAVRKLASKPRKRRPASQKGIGTSNASLAG
jgi:CheY-like chemotaxis protein